MKKRTIVVSEEVWTELKELQTQGTDGGAVPAVSDVVGRLLSIKKRLPAILDDTVNRFLELMYLEFKGSNGYDPDRARAAAVQEVLDGLNAESRAALGRAEQ